MNARFFPKCSPAALRARGPRACPKGSKLGTGSAIGAAPPIVTDPVNAKITLFNGTLDGRNPTIIIYALPDLGPVMTLPGVLRSGRGTPYGYVLDTPVPPIKTLPSAPDASVTFFDATTRDLTVKRRGRTIHYIDSPGAVQRNLLPARRPVHATRGPRRWTCWSASRSAAALAARRRIRGSVPARISCNWRLRARTGAESADCLLGIPVRVAVISDIHSNLPALEAVLADVGQQRPRPGLVPRRRGRLRRAPGRLHRS